MKFLKLTLIAVVAIGLLTAVLPSNETEPIVEPSNHDVKKSKDKLIVLIDKRKNTNPPTNG